MSWEQEPGRLEAVCARVGCRLVRALEEMLGPGAESAWLIDCPSRWHTVHLLDEMAWEDITDPEFRGFARHLETEWRAGPWWCRPPFRTAGPALPGGLPGYLLDWVQKNVPFMDEPIEAFIGWRALHRGGDCDDMARLLVALLRALGWPARLATLGRPPSHVAAQVLEEGRWEWLEPTVPGALYGESPAAACARLGIPLRPDLGGEP